MIDFCKLLIIPKSKEWIKKLQSNPLLDFKKVVSTKTWELSKKQVATYQDLKFIIYENGNIWIKGSLHKYWNHGIHNYNDFNYCSLIEVIEDLKKKFDLDPNYCILRTLEFGVNIIPPIESDSILDSLLIHRNKKFKDKDVGFGNFKQVAHSRYILKAYNKLKQYRSKLSHELFRFELHYKRMIELNQYGIRTLKDLTEIDNLKSLQDRLLKSWNEVLLFDITIDEQKLTELQRNTKLNQWQNPFYWLGLKKQRRNEQKNNYNKVVKKHSQSIHKQIHQLILDKSNYLLNNSLPSNIESINDKPLPSNKIYKLLESNDIPPILKKHYV